MFLALSGVRSSSLYESETQDGPLQHKGGPTNSPSQPPPRELYDGAVDEQPRPPPTPAHALTPDFSVKSLPA